MNKKICFIVQRYGLDVNGGAELHCRQLAEHLKQYYNYDIEVLTTKAKDYITWKDEYENSQEIINKIKVKRFSVKYPTNIKDFRRINFKFLHWRLKQNEEIIWLNKQGPRVPNLIKYLRNNKEKYDVFIFFTYLYYPTVLGVKEVKDKAIVIPTAHNEPFLKMKIFDNVFKLPKALFFNTIEEQDLIHNKFHNENIISDIGGVGIEIPNIISAQKFKEKYKLDKYIVYVGRIDLGKNCNKLFKDFIKYKKYNNNDLKLVLMGKSVIDIPVHKDIISLGFVTDEDKFNGIAGAKLLVLPSKFESLSMVVLEAMALGVPVVVNGQCDVLRGHCIKSKAGLYYNNYKEFQKAINYILNNEKYAKIMGKNGKKYVKLNYQWDVILSKLNKLIEII